MRRLFLFTALAALAIAGCAESSAMPHQLAPSAATSAQADPTAAPSGPVTSFSYVATTADVGPCNENVLTIMNGTAPAYDIAYNHGHAPPLTVANCNFKAGHVVQVTLDTPAYGTPFIAQYVKNSVAIDAPGPAKVLGTWTDMGDPLEGPSHGVSGQVLVTIR
jgi:hypothetical protein